MRHIDWKATARSNHLIVREFTSEDERRVHIVFDTRAMDSATDGGGGAEKFFDARFEHGVTQAAALVAHFLEERAEVRLTLGAEAGHYGTGREHLYACLRRLALVRPQEAREATGAQIDLWSSLAAAPNNADSHYVILLTTSAPGSIPGNVWRMSHVIYL
jgi:uncharacterized protein (DUF58 family)